MARPEHADEEQASLLRSQQHEEESQSSDPENAGGSSTPNVTSSTQVPSSPKATPELTLKSTVSLESMPSSKETTGICRICLEEDLVGNLEAPCGCAGTQRYAHHACIQRWVNEKGNAKCEICEQPYRGAYTVPPPQEVTLDNMPLFTPMYIFETDGRGHRGGLDLLDADSNAYQQRNSSVSWCVSFAVFFMFLVVLHHTLLVADGIDYDDAGASSSAYDPATGLPPTDSGALDGGDLAGGAILFLFWVATKAFLIGIPLYTVMKIAARQARREQYEAMLRAGAAYEASRRVVFRVRPAGARQGDEHAPGAPPAVALAV